MEIYADIRQKVNIDPIDVIQRLINKEITDEGSVFEKDGRYYVELDEYRLGSSVKETTKEKYEYVRALELILNKLKNDNN
jgi:hypothetical protein